MSASQPSPTLSVRGNVAEIRLDALRHNLDVLSAAAAGCEVLCVVKADGYGHGAEIAAHTFQEAGIQRFGVATVEEGLALRAAGVGGTILILGGATWMSAPSALLDADLTPVVSSGAEIRALGAFLRARGAPRPLSVHIGIDTGMGREGFPLGGADPEEAPREIAAALDEQAFVRAVGAMSHFANADLADHELTAAQVDRFGEAVRALRRRGVPLAVAHLANSAATLSMGGRPGTLSADDLDDIQWWVRPGIALYGASPFPDGREQARLLPALTWKAPVVGRKRVPAGTPISYGSTFTTARETELAVLGLGYADGYSRALSGRADVLFGGGRAPILGRVCMDLTVVDVTDIARAQGSAACALGAEAVLLGASGEARIDAWELADQAGTIAYEVLTSVGRRVPRIAR